MKVLKRRASKWEPYLYITDTSKCSPKKNFAILRFDEKGVEISIPNFGGLRARLSYKKTIDFLKKF